ncbi:glucosylglycerol-phosphate synthase [Synechococcus sp. MIT S9504]|uniref:glucosylglycerol-phosphate synthase n=1 Tax=Synechococcus sp. MIT S9504 TaxID=1801628 RepID=UPI0007BB0587|nr:glucosylglycerol-phosphate synthase [Synechococcus sp. MIT S9504]KZR87970.1 Glucosylglycerol-phosphate synthase [Synechococcus sp. MIT S9504]
MNLSIGSSNFIILYHRTPFDEAKDEAGKRIWRDQKSPNGIIPTLRNLFRDRDNGTWIAWRQVDDLSNAEDERIAMDEPASFTLRRIPLEQAQISSFYHVTSKESFWPILHTFPNFFNVNNTDWSIFEEVNQRFADAACSEAAPGATVWVHDYNLWLVPGYIRSKRQDLKIAFFHHTPFPSSDVFSILPWRKQILESLLSCDVVGFHIPRYTENFARAANCLLGVEKGEKQSVPLRFLGCGSALTEPSETPWLNYRGRKVSLLSSPVGTSPDVIQALTKDSHVQHLSERIDEDTKKGRKLILSASRVDYTKGNEELLLAFERLLERRPDLHGKVVLMLACVAAASGMRIYEDTQRLIEETAGRINGRFSKIDWVPIRFSTRRIPYEEMVAWFSQADICWITPLRDGLNLVAKEYAAARKGQAGVLVLSEFTGASVILDGAVLTNPYSHKQMDTAIDSAIDMPTSEQIERMEKMSSAVETFTVSDWADEQMGALEIQE